MKTTIAVLVSLGMIAAAPFPVSAARRDAAVPMRSASEACSDLSLRLALETAQAEMRELLPGATVDSFAGAMNADSTFNSKVQEAFGRSDLVKSEYSSAGCVVTVIAVN